MGFLVFIALGFTVPFLIFGFYVFPYFYRKKTVSRMKVFLFSLGLGIICAFLTYVMAPDAFIDPSTGSGGKHPCAVCGKTEGTRQITAQAGNGKWDENWYCKRHYADAWKYYYGNE